MKKIRGSALIEIIIGAAIISSGILAAEVSYNTYLSYALGNQGSIQAAYLLEEGLEGVTFLRDKGWAGFMASLSTTTTYYLAFNVAYWASTTTPQYVDGLFLRSFSVSDVKRDGNDNIASFGTYDPNIKQVTTSISYWQGHATTTKTLSTYITNIYNN